MKRHKRPTRRRTAAEWAELVESWKCSGQDAATFAATRGVTPKLLAWWRWQLARAPSAVAKQSAAADGSPAENVGVRLVPVEVTPEVIQEAAVTPSWELSTPTGHVLRVHRSMAPGELRALLGSILSRGGRP